MYFNADGILFIYRQYFCLYSERSHFASSDSVSLEFWSKDNREKQ